MVAFAGDVKAEEVIIVNVHSSILPSTSTVEQLINHFKSHHLRTVGVATKIRMLMNFVTLNKFFF